MFRNPRAGALHRFHDCSTNHIKVVVGRLFELGVMPLPVNGATHANRRTPPIMARMRWHMVPDVAHAQPICVGKPINSSCQIDSDKKSLGSGNHAALSRSTWVSAWRNSHLRNRIERRIVTYQMPISTS